MAANAPVVVESVLELVGGTPLVRIDSSRGTKAPPAATVWAKMEQLNPGGDAPSTEQSPVTLTPDDEEEKPNHEQPSTDV